METYTVLEVSMPWYMFLEGGVKRVEGRKKSAKWKHLKVGEVVIIRKTGTNIQFHAQIVAIREYQGDDPLFSYLIGEGIQNALPGVTSVTKAISIYLQWSTPEEIEAMGMLAIELNRIKI